MSISIPPEPILAGLLFTDKEREHSRRHMDRTVLGFILHHSVAQKEHHTFRELRRNADCRDTDPLQHLICGGGCLRLFSGNGEVEGASICAKEYLEPVRKDVHGLSHEHEASMKGSSMR